MITSATSTYALVDFYNMHVTGDKRIKEYVDRATAELLVNSLLDAKEAAYLAASQDAAKSNFAQASAAAV